MEKVDLQLRYIEEITKILAEMSRDYLDDTKGALHQRTVWMGRITFMGRMIDDWLAQKGSDLLKEDKLPQWRFDQMLESSEEGRLARLRKNVMETLKLQCNNIASELIETQSDRKFTGATRPASEG